MGLRGNADIPIERMTADQYQAMHQARERMGLGHIGARRRAKLDQPT